MIHVLQFPLKVKFLLGYRKLTCISSLQTFINLTNLKTTETNKLFS